MVSLGRIFVRTIGAALAMLASTLFGQMQGVRCTPWPATDALGRKVPISEEVGLPKANRFVGIFYFTWHNNRELTSPNWDGPYDVSRILKEDPGALAKPASALWGPTGMFHYWGKPLYGY